MTGKQPPLFHVASFYRLGLRGVLKETPLDPQFESDLRLGLQNAQTRHPDLRVDLEQFLPWLAQRVGLQRAGSYDFNELYLVFACAKGDPMALHTFERVYLPEVDRALTSKTGGRRVIDEVKQRLRQRLLVAEGDGSPKIEEYAGRGPLGGLVRVAATRLALNLLRDETHENTRRNEVGATFALPPIDPELMALQRRFRIPFQQAFLRALESLPSQDRNVLRLHLVDGLTIDHLGSLLSMHRSTAARILEKARRLLASRTRQNLCQMLRLTGTEADSLVRLADGRLDFSISKVLGAPSVTGSHDAP